MTDQMTAADLDAIEQRAHAATEGPWEASAHDHAAGDVPILDRTGHYLVICPDCGVRGGYERADAEFIAHARSDVPALLAEVRRLRAMEQRVREYARHLARPFAPSVRTCRKFRQVDGVPDREGEQIASELLVALDGGE